mgnify:CR=1 FL=1
MKNLKKILQLQLLIVLLITLTGFHSYAVVSCQISKTNGGGFSTTIQTVTQNCDNTYTIVLIVSHNGCSGSNCKALSHYSVEALPGTYSNIQVEVLSGNMTYTNIDLGPNIGGNEPFQGFKIDGIEGIGNGMAGSFSITYTLSNQLQSERTNAKAGNQNQIVSFTVEDFLYVMNCMGTTCTPVIIDTDGDGVIDEDDDYPDDPSRAYNNYYPSLYNWGSLAYEDLWPSKGDYDFNDLVILYHTIIVTDANNNAVDIISQYTIKAIGASYHNGFAFQLDNISPDQIESVAGQVGISGYIPLNANGTEANQPKAVIFVFKDPEDLIHRAQGSFFNTMPTNNIGTSDTVTLNLHFTYPVSLSLVGNPPFNPFIVKNGIRNTEIHLPNYIPTALADFSLFGTSDDKSNPEIGKYYTSTLNLPWALHIPEEFDHVIEYKKITSAYLHFGDWAESNGQVYPDWYKIEPGYRVDSLIWQGY